VNVDVTIPELAESITEAIVGDWLKSPGEHVEEGDLLVDVETDKVVLEITAPKSGELALISKHKNEIVQSNEVIAVINTNKTSSGSSDDLTEAEDVGKESSVAEYVAAVTSAQSSSNAKAKTEGGE